jgi:hypothetical protein
MNKFLILREETRKRITFNENADLSVSDFWCVERSRWFSAGLTARRYSALGEEGENR